MAAVRVGISGWRYRGWRGDFYPVGLRHDSFGSSEAMDLTAGYDIACVASDAGDKWPRFDQITTDFAYLRLHGADELYVSGSRPMPRSMPYG